MKKIVILLIFCNSLLLSGAQLVINGGLINMKNSAYLVIGNAQPAGLTALSASGGIITDANSFIRWKIGTNSAAYTVPFSFNGEYIPLQFTTSGATGNGYFDLNSYNVPTWKNSDYLPTGVTNVNRNGTDNSSHLVDRFWSMAAGGYTIKPNLSNLIFSYRDAEWNAAGNSITETLLKAQRWNATLSRWDDYAPAGTANTGTNTVTIASVTASNLFQWWTLVDAAYPLPLQLLTFTAQPFQSKVLLNWSTATETNTSHFIIERSPNGTAFLPVSSKQAAGNSTSTVNYTAYDSLPLPGRSYYRLKMTDLDGSFTYSGIATVTMDQVLVSVFPIPARDQLFVQLGTKQYTLLLTDAAGHLLQKREKQTGLIHWPIARYAPGVYYLHVQSDRTTVFRVVKE